MQDLIELSARASIREMVVVIGNPLLSNASIALHRSLGFNQVGILRGVGEKFGRALDVLIMQKSLTST
jgi:L-amino acid N-acyltransferase YncA